MYQTCFFGVFVTLKVLDEHKSRESCIAVVADGTGTSTGWKDGMLAHMEKSLRSILRYLIDLFYNISYVSCMEMN